MSQESTRRERKARARAEAAESGIPPGASADRSVGEDGEAPEGAGGPPAGDTEGEELVTLSAAEHARLLQCERDRQLYLDELRRSKAEFENYQKRVRRERPGWEAQAVRSFIQGFLHLVDNFERALELTESSSLASFSEGVRMIYQMVVNTLQDHGVRSIEALGQRFDPTYHEAVAQVETDDAEMDGKVVDVQQKGYLHGDTVIRPARVVVGKRRAPAPGPAEEGEAPEPPGASPPR